MEFLRRPIGLAATGIVVTVVLASIVAVALLLTGGTSALSRNAALIGALIALGGVFTTQMVNTALANRRAQEDRTLETQRAHEARTLETQRAHEAALQKYFEQVGKLLIEHPLRDASPSDNLSIVVRAQTLAVLEGLDPVRKGILLQFLNEAGLITGDSVVINLAGANLSKVDLSRGVSLDETDVTRRKDDLSPSGAVSLDGVDLRDTNLREANLEGVGLRQANLRYASLNSATLTGTVLIGADLEDANLDGANLSKSFLNQATLTGASLRGANLNAYNLQGANLRGANLHKADLTEARGLERELLEQAHGDHTTQLPKNFKMPDSWSGWYDGLYMV